MAILGLNAITSENTNYSDETTDAGRAAAYAAPTFVIRTNIRDVTINNELATADITTRAGGGYRQVAATLAEASIDFQIVYEPADAFFTNLKNSFENRYPMDIVFADGLVGSDLSSTVGSPLGTAGVIYFRSEFVITNFSINVGLEEAMTVDVSLQSGFSDNAPGFLVIV